jgi:hypothetical protein
MKVRCPAFEVGGIVGLVEVRFREDGDFRADCPEGLGRDVGPYLFESVGVPVDDAHLYLGVSASSPLAGAEMGMGVAVDEGLLGGLDRVEHELEC